MEQQLRIERLEAHVDRLEEHIKRLQDAEASNREMLIKAADLIDRLSHQAEDITKTLIGVTQAVDRHHETSTSNS